MLEVTKNGVIESSYDIKDEAKLASIFGIGNGYFGLRGSLEEFGDVFIQGLYIRGVFDQIVEIPSTFSDNVYMKNYYFDGQKLKEFELEDSCINICDPIQIRFYINGKHFLPWVGKVLSWNRYIDYTTGGLTREVTWDDGDNHITKFIFKRYCSFANNHLMMQEVSVEKINHDLPIEVFCGVDTLVKTNGQHKSKLVKHDNYKDGLSLKFYMGNKYNHEVALSSKNEYENMDFVKVDENDGFYYSVYKVNNKKASINKVISMFANIDKVSDIEVSAKENLTSYKKALKDHIKEYQKDFDMIDIKIKDDPILDQELRYANYQTLIGFDRKDSVHSLSAKNLTSEKYNQFVWWDAEIFQLPIVLATFPNAAKACSEYRYRCLDEARKIASKDGYKGAKFAFCSSVKGDENVWIYARHPFLQIHIASDVAYGVINYFNSTNDKEFMMDKGLVMILEVIRYFASRVTLRDDGLYHLENVTGTDEHHPYVNDDAYTNYEVRFITKEFAKYIKLFDLSISKDDEEAIFNLSDKLYIPLPNKDGLIPQFENYFSLNPQLELCGNGAATGFQMKASGLYHLSQIIKQPDVLNLFTYLSIGMDKNLYKKNFDFYYEKCESSSSLTYPVHALGALQTGHYDLFIENLKNSLTVDIVDIFKGAYQGVHAGCLAGGYYNIYRGIFGIDAKLDCLCIDPICDSPIKNVEMNFMYQNEKIHIKMDDGKVTLKKSSSKPIKVITKGCIKWLDDNYLNIN